MFEFQENDCAVFVEVQQILSVDQFWKLHPSVQLLNPDEDIFVVCDRVIVSSASITSEVVPPLNLLLWNHSRLTPIQGEVRKFPYPINSFMEYLFLQEYVDFIKKHPLKNKHGNKPVVIAPIVLYSDDTSGNRSKKWNKFDCWCLSMAGLPIRDARKIENIHFICCSNQVSAMEIAIPLADDLRSLEQGIELYDNFMKRTVVVYSHVMCFLCDNVRASELTNHLGSKASRLCRFCMVRNKYN